MKKLIFFLTLPFLLQGCSVIFTRNTKTTIVAADKGATITCEGSLNRTTGIDSITIKLSNNWDDYVVTAKKDGFLPYSAPIIRSRFNKVKLLDVLVPLAADGYVVSSMGSKSSNNSDNATGETLLPIAYMTGTLGWLILGAGEWRIYPKNFSIPPLQKAPKKDEDESNLVLSKIAVNIPAADNSRSYFSDFRSYSRDKAIYKSSEKDAMVRESIDLVDEVRTKISEYGYTDTAAGILQSRFTVPQLTCTLTGMNLVKVGNNYHLEVTVTQKLLDPVSGAEMIATPIKSSSSWRILKENENQESEMLTEGLANSIALFLREESTKNILKKFKKQNAASGNNNAPLTIARNGIPANSLKEAASAVVTIKTKNGHGSGDIISNDGYVITNLHVVADQLEDSVDIIFADETKSKAKIVRYNATFDLCLLKTSPLNVHPLQFDTIPKIDIGQEVYAIGTPAELELGQSVSKGIVSGKRTFKNLTFIQTDVSINPGNSGGALVTHTGELIGIVDAKIVGTGFEGLGFAIPASQIPNALGITVR